MQETATHKFCLPPLEFVGLGCVASLMDAGTFSLGLKFNKLNETLD
jgi:hypothetical protein